MRKSLSVTIPHSVQKIGYRAFAGCNRLRDIFVDGENTAYHMRGNCLIETESKTVVFGHNEPTIPDDGSVTSIGYGTFSHCDSITSMVIPGSVRRIGGDTFWDCSNLESVTMQNGVEEMDHGAFHCCKKLTHVEMPASVKRIACTAFEGCYGLTIHAPKGSCAEQFAKEVDIPFAELE